MEPLWRRLMTSGLEAALRPLRGSDSTRCRSLDLDRILPSQFIFNIFNSGGLFFTCGCCGDGQYCHEFSKKLFEWRFPGISLNLLQLAILFKEERCMSKLWQPVFLQEDSYRDTSGKLVNHPLHLLVWTSPELSAQFNVTSIRTELFYEEGHIDLTSDRQEAARVREGAFRSAQSSEGETPGGCPVYGPRFATKWTMERLLEESAALNRLEAIRLCPLQMTAELPVHPTLLLSVLGKMVQSAADTSAVELFWRMTRDLKTARVETNGTEMDATRVWLHSEDKLILICQLIPTVHESYWDLALSMLRLAVEGFFEISITKAIRFLPDGLLHEFLRGLPQPEESQIYLGEPERLDRAITAVENELEGRGLQHLCVLSILKAVKGDARKVWSLSELPLPLKMRFDIPFRALYGAMEFEDQAQEDPQSTENRRMY